jgi:hypothetical protein
MSKPTSPTADHKAATRPKRLKLYTYGGLEFVLHQGGQPRRQFDIDWMKEESATSAIDCEPGNEDPTEGYRRG